RERGLPTNRPTPDRSEEGSRHRSASCRFPSWEGSGVGSGSRSMRISAGQHSMNHPLVLVLVLVLERVAWLRGRGRAGGRSSPWFQRKDEKPSGHSMNGPLSLPSPPPKAGERVAEGREAGLFLVQTMP